MLGASGHALPAEDAPLSAIDWLSNSVDVAPDPQVISDQPLATLPDSVTVLPLDAPTADDAGLKPASDLGLDPGFWGRSSASDLAWALIDLPDSSEAPPSTTRFLRELLVTEFRAPIDAAIDDQFFLARVDRLLALGQLDLAQDLISKAGPIEPNRFRRAFDIALLRGEETEACRVIEETPDLSPTYPARIFCLARLGQWDVAALTLGNAEALGILTPEENQLLLHFLDAELFEGEPVPPPPPVPSPLLFRLYEAVGEQISTDRLPVAFAFSDLGSTSGWKARLRAVERLAAVEALPFDRLIEVFSERKPAASGGVWERARALQALLRAVETDKDARINATLSSAWVAAKQVGYATAFAGWVTPNLDGRELSGRGKDAAFEIALRAGQPDIAQQFAAESAEDAFLLSLATGQGGQAPGGNLLNQAVRRGLVALSPGPTFEALLADDRRGEALFRALGHLKRGAGGNPQATQDSLALLKKLGLGDLARQVAVELILMDEAA